MFPFTPIPCDDGMLFRHNVTGSTHWFDSTFFTNLDAVEEWLWRIA